MSWPSCRACGRRCIWSRVGKTPWNPCCARRMASHWKCRNLDWVTAFLSDAPPAQLAFYSPPSAAAARADAPAGLRPLMSAWCRSPSRASARSCRSGWPGVYTATDMAQALACARHAARGRAASSSPKATWWAATRSRSTPPIPSRPACWPASRKSKTCRSRRARRCCCPTRPRPRPCARSRPTPRPVRRWPRPAPAPSRPRGACTRCQMDVLKLSQAMERFSARSGQIREELSEIEAQIEEQRAVRAESEATFEQHDTQLAEMQAAHEDHQMAFEALDGKLTGARQQLRDFERAAQEAVFGERNLSGRIDELRRNIQMAADQSERIAESLENARVELETINEQTAHTRPARGAGSARREGREAVGGAHRAGCAVRPAPPVRRTAPGRRAQPAAAARPHHRVAAQGAGRAPEPGAVHRAAGRPRRSTRWRWPRS